MNEKHLTPAEALAATIETHPTTDVAGRGAREPTLLTLEGLSQLLKNIQMIQKHLNSKLRISTILLTMYDARTNLAFQVAEEVREHFPEETLSVKIPRSVRISEAPSYQQTVITYDSSSTGARAYREAAQELSRRSA